MTETDSTEDINSFGLRIDTVMMSIVGNSGNVYLLQKTEQYNPAGFAMAFGNKLLPELAKAQSEIDYVDIINSFLKEAAQYGIRFITGG